MAHAWIFVVGVLIEGVAILVFAAPDYVPGLRRFSAWLAPRLRRAERRARNAIRRVLRHPPTPVVHQVSAGGAIAAGLSARGIHGVSPTATLEEKVDFLLRRAEITQEVTATLSDRIAAISSKIEHEITELRDESRAHVAAELKSAEEADRPLRLIGSLLLIAGVACQSIASLL